MWEVVEFHTNLFLRLVEKEPRGPRNDLLNAAERTSHQDIEAELSLPQLGGGGNRTKGVQNMFRHDIASCLGAEMT